MDDTKMIKKKTFSTRSFPNQYFLFFYSMKKLNQYFYFHFSNCFIHKSIHTFFFFLLVDNVSTFATSVWLTWETLASVFLICRRRQPAVRLWWPRLISSFLLYFISAALVCLQDEKTGRRGDQYLHKSNHKHAQIKPLRPPLCHKWERGRGRKEQTDRQRTEEMHKF